jgi:UDP-GlcNAc:undecaprenyl-phosphate GlcNAc-1-phosphate transferase
MGDAGSQLLGFAVGVLSLRATQSGASMVSAATPVLLLALPILDTLSVMVQRLGEGRSPFSADRNHIHHKLLSFGFGHHEAVVVIYAVQADLFLMAYWMRYESDVAIMGVVTAFFLGSLALLQLATRRHWRFRAGGSALGDSHVTRLITRIGGPAYLPRWSYLGVAAALAVYSILVVAEAAKLSGDVKLLVIALLAVALAGLAIRRFRPFNLVERCVCYVTVAVLVYLDALMEHEELVPAVVVWCAVLAAAIGTLLRLRLAGDRRFVLTPLDLIVLFVALVVPSLAGSLGLPQGGSLGIAKLVVLFYAVEVLVSRMEMPAVWLRAGTAAVLAGLLMLPLL